MQVTVELSKYPLDSNYIPPIKDFIKRIGSNPDFKVLTSATSTQIAGEYDLVMTHIQNEIKESYKKYGKAVFVMKVLKGNLLS